MRLLTSLSNQDKAQRLAAYLNSEGIATRLEATYVRDWGSDDYGTWRLDLWILEEDQHEKAKQLMGLFDRDPAVQQLHEKPLAPLVITGPGHAGIEKDIEDEVAPEEGVGAERPTGTVTLWLLGICIMLFIVSSLTTPMIKGTSTVSIPRQLLAALVTSPLKSQFMYDWPKAYQMVDQFEARFGVEAFLNPLTLAPEGTLLFTQIVRTPFWEGLYPMAVQALQQKSITANRGAPLFEKIRDGELWRLVSPIFLHGDIFHILFNMLWLLVLGKQLEDRLGIPKYLLFIVLVAIVSNTAQYLMSGPNFLGFSGVLAGMLAFIWQRQRTYPWEGYHLQPQTINFVFFFIMALFGLQIISFIVEVSTGSALTPGIANTAHLTGAFTGWLLSWGSTFSAKD